MFTASDVRKRLKETNLVICDGIDEWIESVLVPKFAVKRSVTISDIAVKWSKDSFMASMQQRGFHVEYYCEKRPYGGCWYKITLPLGDE